METAFAWHAIAVVGTANWTRAAFDETTKGATFAQRQLLLATVDAWQTSRKRVDATTRRLAEQTLVVGVAPMKRFATHTAA